MFRFTGFVRTLFCTSFLVIPATFAQAQTAGDIDNANRQSESIQRQQLQRQGEDIQRSLQNKRPQSSIDLGTPDLPKGTGEGCMNVKDVVIADALKLDPAKADAITAPYENTCVDVIGIQTLLSEITKFYIDHGYVASRAYLPAQDLSTGTLRIQVVEGKIGQVILDEESKGSANLVTAFPMKPGKDLNLRDFEQGLDQVNRLQSNNATLELVPGAQVGESVVMIRNQPSKRWHMNVTGDNYGTTTTGRAQVGATLGVDNLLGLNDYISITERPSDWPFTDSDKQSSATTGIFSLPFRYTTFTMGYTYSNYDSTLPTPGGVSLALSGDNQAAFATIDHVLYRDQDSRLTANLGATRKTANNYVDDTKLDVSSRTLTVMDVGLNYSTVLVGGSANASVGYSRGLDIFGAMDDTSGLPDTAPRAQFSKLTASAGYYRPFELWEQSFSVSTQVSGQYALDTLYGSEQVSVGGIYTVRGFYEEVLAGDHGAYWRNDLAWNKPVGSVFGYDAMLKPYIGVDAGFVDARESGNGSSGTLVGAAVGIGFMAGPISFDIYTGHPISMPDEVENEHFNTFARLSVNF